MKRKKEVLSDTLKKCLPAFAAGAVSYLCAAAVFFLYGQQSAEPYLYAAALLLLPGAVLFAVTFFRGLKTAEKRERAIRAVMNGEAFPPAPTLAEADWQEAVRRLLTELTAVRNEYGEMRQDELDYYTAWIHQIKTPIAVLRMQLGGGESDRATEAALFRLEQYADMALTYVRLGGSTDLVLREYPLDGLIREVIRKYAPLFVAGRLRLDYEGAEGTVVTDRKWFTCILEQILSNAIKYTPSGTVTVRAEGETLTVSDTGIGIAPEDVPRIFEKGYTGENGHVEKRSSGLGLYLCRKAADLLAVPLSVESTVGQGSTFTLDLTGKRH